MFRSKRERVAAFELFSERTDDLIFQRRGELSGLARQVWRRGMSADAMRDAANSIGEPLRLTAPKLVEGDAGLKIELGRVGGVPVGVPASLPDGTGRSHPDPEPRQVLSVTLLVEGDASLLRFKPCGIGALSRYVADGTKVYPTDTGGSIEMELETGPDDRPMKKEDLQAYRNGIAFLIERLRRELANFCSSPSSQVMGFFEEWEADARRREAEDAKTRANVEWALGLTVG